MASASQSTAAIRVVNRPQSGRIGNDDNFDDVAAWQFDNGWRNWHKQRDIADMGVAKREYPFCMSRRRLWAILLLSETCSSQT